MSAPPTSYRIRYAVTDFSGSSTSKSVETVAVRRPFEGRQDVAPANDEQGGGVTSTTVTAFGRVSLSGGANGVLIETPPSLAAGDLRLDASLPDAERHRTAARRERRRVDGIECQVFRTAEPLAVAALRARATDVDYTDSCVSGAGLVLEELWVVDGTPLRHRIATSVDIGDESAITDDMFAALGRRIEPDQGGGSVRPVDPSTRPAGMRFWEPTRVPAGFVHEGRYAIVPPTVGTAGSQESAPSKPRPSPSPKSRIGAVADVWLRGVDVVVVEQGGTVGGAPVFAIPARARTISTPVGQAEVVVDGRGNELRIPLPGGRYVRLFATLATAELEALADSLHDIGEGTGLSYLDA